MELDLSKGIYLKIEGELGKFKTLPISSLVKIATKLEELILNIARYDIESDEAIDLDNFKIELSGFYPGCAVPEFIYTPRLQYTTSDVVRQRKKVNDRFKDLIEIASQGNYLQLKEFYPDPLRRNTFTETLYEFVNSPGRSPMSFAKKENQHFEPVFKLHHFKKEVKEKLLADIKEPANVLEEPQTFYAKMKSFKDSSGKTRNKTIKQIHSEDASLAFSPKDIKYEDRVFKLHTPLHCKVDIEDGYYVIQNDQLGIVGTGDTFEGAIESFSEEFDFIVNHYRKLDENQMSPRIKRAKDILQIILID